LSRCSRQRPAGRRRRRGDQPVPGAVFPPERPLAMAPLTKLVELEHDQQLAELVESWDFSRGKSFQNMVLADLGAPVHHPSSSPAGSFSLLAVFRRYTFRLTEDSVSLALHACLGGAPAGFHVTYIQDRHFRFVVSCKQVGFKVCDLKRVITEHFDVYFHLWRDGGARWIGELKRWNREEEAGWTKVTRKKGKKYGKRVSFSNKIAQDSPVKLSRPPELEETNPSSRPTWTIQFGSFSYQVQVEDPQAELVGQENQADQFAGSSIEDGDSQNVIHGAEAIRRLKVDEAVQIPVYRVYSKLRRDLRIDGVDGSGSSSEAHTPTQPPLSANRWKGCRVSDRGNVACFKCLGLGHFVRDCREEIRCFFFALTMGTGHESAANVNLASPALGLPSPLIRNGLLQASRCMRRTALTQATPPHFSAKARLLGATFLPPSQKSSALQFHPQSTNL